MSSLRTVRQAVHASTQAIKTTAAINPSRRFLANVAMATPYQMKIVAGDTGLWKVKQTNETAAKVSQLLQEDLEKHHCFFNHDGFHNHITHHLLSLYGTGANSAIIQKGYNDNVSYQRNHMPVDEKIVGRINHWDESKQYFGKEKYYPDFLLFFQRECERLGWEGVLNEYVFKGDERADDLFIRLFEGFLHPLIQLMYGVEWAQPAIVAEGLAQACVHSQTLPKFLLTAEKNARASSKPMGALHSLYAEVRADKKLAGAAHNEDANKVRDGVLARAFDEMLAIASKVKVEEAELETRTVEMFNNTLAVAAAAAFHPPKRVKFDFFLIHHVNSSPFFLALNKLSSISTAAKVRMLETKIRMDLLQYAGRAVPPLDLGPISSYKPTTTAPSPGEDALAILSPLHGLDEDGHAIKLARAAGICEQISEAYEKNGKGPDLPVRGKEMWNKIHHMIVDSVQGPEVHWVRTAGLDEAWKDIEDQAKL